MMAARWRAGLLLVALLLRLRRLLLRLLRLLVAEVLRAAAAEACCAARAQREERVKRLSELASVFDDLARSLQANPDPDNAFFHGNVTTFRRVEGMLDPAGARHEAQRTALLRRPESTLWRRTQRSMCR